MEADRCGIRRLGVADLAHDLAHEIDVSHALNVLFLGVRMSLNGNLRDHPDDEGLAALDLDELADGRTGAVETARPLAREPDAHLRATDGMDMAKQSIGHLRRPALISKRVGP